MIEVRIVTGGYLANATPPHVKSEWWASEPMSARAIISELQKLGAHQTDIGDAFLAADPDWIDAP